METRVIDRKKARAAAGPSTRQYNSCKSCFTYGASGEFEPVITSLRTTGSSLGCTYGAWTGWGGDVRDCKVIMHTVRLGRGMRKHTVRRGRGGITMQSSMWQMRLRRGVQHWTAGTPQALRWWMLAKPLSTDGGMSIYQSWNSEGEE